MRKIFTPQLLTDLFKQMPRPHRIGLAAASAFVGLLILLPSEKVEASRHTESLILETGKRYPLSISVAESEVISELDDEPQWQTFKVKSGDTLAKIFKRAGLSPKDTYAVSHAGEQAKTLVTLLPGDKLDLNVINNQFAGLRYALSPTDTLYIEPQADSNDLVSRIDTKAVEVRYNFAQGEITSSFWNAGVAAGLTDNQIMHLASIFGWDIDFAMEIRSGDSFNVVFEERYIDGEFVGYGDIVAAEFVNQGDMFQAIQHEDGNYYTPQGRSMRKSFLRAPINFKYVSSNFSKARFHPVQKRWKAHRGTDYVAAVGTPVMAAGDGKVIEAGYNKFNGNYVFIQHGEKYVTKYLHFKKKAVKKGETVKQGQTVGYLGSTGMASGPHLHYEFLVDGVHRNPRTVDLPKARPIAASQRSAFNQIAQQRLAQLNTSRRIMLAMK
ncbi:OapA family protein [Alteromonas lipolytica]|uniref:Peptidase M23 n=1 Tax=Alteromonas lipolytica TaxID=1856405 RepID=A0A1E8FAC7_9ALTE|nr:peptidoglycan DD-metalloendopeptidase family protein [Alteromonas lipolytica]OFI32736.1 peptidase M23 [Alteromonas lipolytica]GGF73535.1 family M23 zinc metallopeptidase with OapA domain protein [Alteromonas lipolytica]